MGSMLRLRARFPGAEDKHSAQNLRTWPNLALGIRNFMDDNNSGICYNVLATHPCPSSMDPKGFKALVCFLHRVFFWAQLLWLQTLLKELRQDQGKYIYYFVRWCLIIIFFFWHFRATCVAYGSSQARGRIGAAAAGLHHSHSNMGSQPHLWPTPKLTATPDP